MNNTDMKTENKSQQGFLSREHTGMLRGLAIILIVAVHFFNIYTDFAYLSMFAGVGVSIFLIISGYGISESYRKKGLRHFFRDKLLKIYLPALVVFLVFSLINRSLTPVGLAKGLLLIGLKTGWYLQLLFILYILFFISVKLFKDKFCIVFFFVPLALVFIPSQLWAEQALCFSLGVFASHFNLNELYTKKNIKFFVIALFVGLALAFAAFSVRHRLPDFYVFNNICWLVFKTSLAAVAIISTQLIKTALTTKLFGLVGKVSFALYLIHLYIFELVFSKGFTPLLIIAAFVITAVLSVAYTIIIDKYYTSVKRRLENE